MGDSLRPAKPGSWESIVKEKRDLRTRAVKPHLNVARDDNARALDATILKIDDISELTGLLMNGKLSAHEVVSSYIRRAAESHEQVSKCFQY